MSTGGTQQPQSTPGDSGRTPATYVPKPGDPHPLSPVPPSQGGVPSHPSRAGNAAPVQDLLQDKLLLAAPRVEFKGKFVPALGGIPILSRIGQGGMGAVYLGVHPRLDQDVAVKVLPFTLMQQQPQLVDRFMREARIAARVKSPHLVGVLDVNEENGLFFLVMEYVAGASAGSVLRAAIKAGHPGLSENMALEICIAATQGLAIAHDEGVVHRDIKPDNILIPRARSGEALLYSSAKLSDLGLARDDESGQSLTGTQAALGTPGYMSPEQAMDAKKAGKPADVFSMGATLHALLTGQSAFTGSSPMEIIFATIQKPPAPISQVRKDISLQTQTLIERCLDKSPDRRYADGNILLHALKACRDAVGDQDRTTRGAVVPMQLPPAIPDRTPQPSAEKSSTILNPEARPPSLPPQPARKSNPWPMIGIAAAALIAIGLAVGTWYLIQKPTPKPVAQPEVPSPQPEPRRIDPPQPPPSRLRTEDLKPLPPPPAERETVEPPEKLRERINRREMVDRRGVVNPKNGSAERPRLSNDEPPVKVVEDEGKVIELKPAENGEGKDQFTVDLKPMIEELQKQIERDGFTQGAVRNPNQPVPIQETEARDEKIDEEIEVAQGYLDDGKYTEARVAFERLKKKTKNAEQLIEIDEGLEDAKQGLADDRFTKHMLEGRVALKNQLYKEAVEAFASALREKPDSADARTQLAQARERLNDKPAANIQKLSGTDRYSQAINAAREAVYRQPPARLGAQVQDLNEDLKKRYGLSANSGAVVMSILPGSPAEKAGLKQGHCITAVGIVPVTNAASFMQAVRNAQPGRTLVQIVSEREALNLNVELGPKVSDADLSRKWADAEANYRRALVERPNDPTATGELMATLNLAGREALEAGRNQEAFNAYNKAAQMNDPAAQYMLGWMYYKGTGTRQDLRRAAEWYTKSAALGNMYAQYDLGCLYMNGWGVAQNDAEAVRLFQLAANQNLPIAQNNLGVMYLGGRGVQANRNEAYRWIKKAAEAGEPLGVQNLKQYFGE
ncbi:MAG TPA: protein kinase [Planctomycetota bacterium]|nr:protein kinase [Planctomycetota bacterium]